MRENLHPVEQEELMAYLDGELSVDQAARTAAHRQECRECQACAAELKSVAESLTAWDVEQKEPQLSAGLAQALEERERHSQAGDPRGRWYWLGFWRLRGFAPWVSGAVAGAMAVLLLTFTLISSFSRGERRLGSAARSTEIVMQPAERTVIPSPGGDRDHLPSPAMKMSGSTAALLAQPEQSLQLSSSTAPPPAPMILRTAQLTLVAQNFDKARTETDQILHRHQGYVGDLTVSSPADGPRKLTATLRVPASQMNAALSDLKTLGRIESESQSGQDVTAQYVDLEARLTNASNTEQRLTDLLRQRTGKLSDVLEVETEFSRVRGEIEQMEAERRLLSKQVEFSTITATVTEEFKAQVVPKSLGTRFRNAAIDGYQSVMNFVLDVALLVVSAAPMLLLWAAILFFPARFLWRKLRSGQLNS